MYSTQRLAPLTLRRHTHYQSGRQRGRRRMAWSSADAGKQGTPHVFLGQLLHAAAARSTGG